MLRKILVFSLMIFAFVCTPVYAELTVQELESLPDGAIEGKYILKAPNNNDELLSIESVKKEVDFLEKSIPVLKDKNWPIYIIKQKLVAGIFEYSGMATKWNSTVYLFADSRMTPSNNYIEENTVTHELGHLVRYNFVSTDDLQKYIELRNADKKYPDINYSPEELFAEDFRWLFGSDNAKGIGYLQLYDFPSSEEKYWISDKLGTKLTWQEKLELYKFDHEAGIKEINRVEKTIQQKQDSGDKKGFLSASNWLKLLNKVIKSI